MALASAPARAQRTAHIIMSPRQVAATRKDAAVIVRDYFLEGTE